MLDKMISDIVRRAKANMPFSPWKMILIAGIAGGLWGYFVVYPLFVKR